ncbi:MAG: hypothetical protein K6T88_16380 [Bacillus sp. (in: Bacteria)]|nr:hypothetical protein [Bacillus sp. (in: firmicutes)]
MGFSILFLLTWLFSALFVVIQKKLSIIENTFIFLLILIVGINFSWITIEEMKLITLSKNGLDYTAFLLNQSVLFPMLLLIQLNLLQRSKTVRKTIIITFSSVGIMLGISFLLTFYNVTDYTKWNYGYDAIYYFGLHLIAFYSYKSFRKVTKSVVEYS